MSYSFGNWSLNEYGKPSVKLKLSPPWVTYVNKLQALFDGDPQIAFNVNYESDDPTVVLATNNGDKATALVKLLPEGVKFGNVTLKINVDGPFSNRAFVSLKELFEVAFEKNPAFAYCVAPVEEGYYYIDFVYVVFKNCVVQFFNDNLNDAHGIVSTLYQDIAAEIFDKPELTRAHYCTDVERGNLGKPLGEWP